jgi:hypothetical protein
MKKNNIIIRIRRLLTTHSLLQRTPTYNWSFFTFLWKTVIFGNKYDSILFQEEDTDFLIGSFIGKKNTLSKELTIVNYFLYDVPVKKLIPQLNLLIQAYRITKKFNYLYFIVNSSDKNLIYVLETILSFTAVSDNYKRLKQYPENKIIFFKVLI